MAESRDYGVLLTAATAIYVGHVKYAVVTDFAVSADWTPATGDVKVSIDGGAAANITNLPAYVTNVGWKYILTAAELTGSQCIVRIADSATKAIADEYFIVETFGHASSMYPKPDSTSPVASNVLQISSSTTPVTNLTADYNGTGYAKTLSTTGLLDGAITAAKIATDAITAVKIADNAITSTKIATGALTSAKFAASALVSQTIGLNDGAIVAATIASSAITSAKIAAGALTGFNIGLNDGAITTAKFGASAIGTAAFSPTLTASIADAIWDEPVSGHQTDDTYGLFGQSFAGDVMGSTDFGITLETDVPAVDDLLNGWTVVITAGTGAGQVGEIIDMIGSTRVVVVTPNWATRPDITTSKYRVFKP